MFAGSLPLQSRHKKEVTRKVFSAKGLGANFGVFAPFLGRCCAKYSSGKSYGRFLALGEFAMELSLEMIMRELGEKSAKAGGDGVVSGVRCVSWCVLQPKLSREGI
jgi:hypothetical protein